MSEFIYSALIVLVFCFVLAVEFLSWLVESVFNLLSPVMWY